jgi:hypothetical protein
VRACRLHLSFFILTRITGPGRLSSIVTIFYQLYITRRACEHAKKKGHERAKVRASRLHLFLFILTPNAAPGCYMALFQYLYHPNIPLPRPCGRYRVPGQTYARTV